MKRFAGVVWAATLISLALSMWTASTAWANSVTPLCNGQPCVTTPGFWYTNEVWLTWDISPTPPSQVSGCGSQLFGSDQIDMASCAATWSGNTLSDQFTIRVEVSTPVVWAVPARPPDFNGWYHSPVAIAFQGSAFSGMSSCTTTTYAGPDTPDAAVGGSCTDNAGKTISATSSPLAYDANPALAVTADPNDLRVVLSWTINDVAPLAGLDIVRSPGLRGGKESLVYSGSDATFRDRHVRDGIRYRYTLTARDQAGNTIVRTVTVTPGPRLIAPANGTRVSTPPLLRWTPVRGASYYNVQLYRDATKVLSAWPTRARLQLRHAWSYRGPRRLRAGRYHWYVWPGFGPRWIARYGRAIGNGTFVVTRVA